MYVDLPICDDHQRISTTTFKRCYRPDFLHILKDAISTDNSPNRSNLLIQSDQSELVGLLEQNVEKTPMSDIPTQTLEGRNDGLFVDNDEHSTSFLDENRNGELRFTESEQDDDHGCRKYSKLILPHVGLVLLTCTYTLLGATVFYSIEQPHEQMVKRQRLDDIFDRQERLLDSLWTSTRTEPMDELTWKSTGRKHLLNVTDKLFDAFEKAFLTANEVRLNDTAEIWSFSTSIFFAVTVVTTIGYGNPVPVTTEGRLLCVFFALFGIPLTLVTVADIGKFFSEHLVWLYGQYGRLKHLIHMRMDFVAPDQHVCRQCRKQALVQGGHRIPATLVLAILVLYTALGGVLMSKLETWSFFTAFYFSFITMTTVGFGDLMPRRDHFMYITLLYIVIGLAITTMCIDLVGIQYIRKIHYFGRKIHDARLALAVVGDKARVSRLDTNESFHFQVVLVSELCAKLMQKRDKNGIRDTFVIDNLYISKHIIPFIPVDIRRIRFIDQGPDSMSLSTSSTSVELYSCRFCHSRFSVTQ